MHRCGYPKSYSKQECVGERRCLKSALPIVCLNCFCWNYNYVQPFFYRNILRLWYPFCFFFFNYKYGFSNRTCFYKNNNNVNFPGGAVDDACGLLMQGTWVWSLVWKDPTHHRQLKPVHCHCWSQCTLGSSSHNLRAPVSHLL